MSRGLERLKELGLTIVEKRRLRVGLIIILEYLNGSYKEDGSSLHKKPHGTSCTRRGFVLISERNFLQ